jgi:hypothetical protein
MISFEISYDSVRYDSGIEKRNPMDFKANLFCKINLKKNINISINITVKVLARDRDLSYRGRDSF